MAELDLRFLILVLRPNRKRGRSVISCAGVSIYGLYHTAINTGSLPSPENLLANLASAQIFDIETRIPVYTHILKTLENLHTIRAFAWEENFKMYNRRYLDGQLSETILSFVLYSKVACSCARSYGCCSRNSCCNSGAQYAKVFESWLTRCLTN